MSSPGDGDDDSSGDGGKALVTDRSLRAALAGLSAGVVSTCIFHPVDLLKTRLQVQVNKQTYRGFVDAARSVVTKEGPRALTQVGGRPFTHLFIGFFLYLTFNRSLARSGHCAKPGR